MYKFDKPKMNREQYRAMMRMLYPNAHVRVPFGEKNWFFDSKPVTEAVDRARIKVLAAQGAFVRRSAKSSIRKRKKPSLPGKPPSSHVGLLREFIFFSYDKSTDSVVIGPYKLNMSADNSIANRGSVPEILEHGGDFDVSEVLFDQSIFFRNVDRRTNIDKWNLRPGWRRIDYRMGRRHMLAGMQTRRRRVSIAARPFMGPALASGMDGYARKWKDTVK
jgi:hypothetical protein